MSVIDWIIAACLGFQFTYTITILYYGWVSRQERKIGAAYRRGDANAREKFPTSFGAWLISWVWWSK